jgi:ABC-2 type transport system permease protein
MAVRRESRLKVAFVSLGIGSLWLVALALAWGSFRFVDRYGVELLGGAPVSLVELLLPRLLAVFALLLLVMLTFSAALLAYATLFRSREVAFLLTTPGSLRSVVLSRFVEVVFFASWASAYLGSPVLLAYGLVRGVGWEFYLCAVAAFVPFVIIPAAVGTILAMTVAPVLSRVPRVAVAVGGLAVLLGSFLVFQSRLRASLTLHGPVEVGALLQLSGRSESPWLPSFWYTESVLSAAGGQRGEMTFWLLLLLANAAFAVLLVAELAQRSLYRGWEALASAPPRTRRNRPRLTFLEWLGRPLPAATRALLVKDITLFLREPSQWAQVLVFFGVLALYVANLKVPTHGYGAQFWQSLITALNTVASLLVLATLTTRFVFPLVSLEGHRFWILGLAPLSVRQLLREKLILAASATSTVTVTLAVVSAWRLGLPPLQFVFSVATVLVASIALAALAVGLGSVYPDFSAENPSRIVSGLGGTLTFLLSVAYVIVVATAQTVVFEWQHVARRWGVSAGRGWAVLAASVVILTASALAGWLPLRLGNRHLEQTEL